MIPTVGRIVHYTSLGSADGKYPSEQQAAIITVAKRVFERQSLMEEGFYEVCLHVFYKTGDFSMENVPFSEEYKRGCWTWPPVFRAIQDEARPEAKASPKKIDVMNKFMVGGTVGGLVIMTPPQGRILYDDALLLAAYLVAMAEPSATMKFEDVLTAVEQS